MRPLVMLEPDRVHVEGRLVRNEPRMQERNLAGPDTSDAPVTAGGGTQPLTGWGRLALWAAGRAVVAVLVGVTGVDWLLTASGAKGAANLAGAYAVAFILLAIAAAAFVSGALRLVRVRRVVRDPAIRTVSPPMVMGRRVRVRCGRGVPDLEWKVLATRRPVSGPLAIHGALECGSWLVVRLSDHRLIWPAARAQPVIGTGMAPVPPIAVADLDVIAAHRRLLGAYAHVISTVNALPFLVRIPLAEWEPSWWRLGAPRPVIGGLVAAHVRKRLRALGNAHIRAAALADGDAARRALREAGQECKELADTLHRSTWPAQLASFITFSVPVCLAFIPKPSPEIHLDTLEKGAVLVAGLTFLFFASAPLVMLFRSILCERTLFRPGERALFNKGTISHRPATINESRGWDICRFEREAFLRAATAEPRQWEERPYIPWLVVAGYGLGVAIPFIIRTEEIFRRVYVLVVVFVCFRVFLNLLLYAIGDLTIRLRRARPER